MAGWYRDKASENIDPEVVMQAAGGIGKAIGAVAKIPLDIEQGKQQKRKLAQEDRKLDQGDRALDNEEYGILMRQYVADAGIKKAGIAANGKVAAAQIGLQGKQASAFARMYDADIKRANKLTDYDQAQINNITKMSNASTQKEIAQINRQPRQTPSTEKTYKYDQDGNKIGEVSKPYIPLGDFSTDDKRKKMHGIDISASKGK